MIKKILPFIFCAWFTSASYASGFQIWEQNAAGVGDYHAGGAAQAEDASTEFYNPAGMTRIKEPQLVLGGVWVNADIRYQGTVEVSTLTMPDYGPVSVNVPGGGNSVIPDLFLVLPLSSKWSLGFGAAVPFGARLDYGDDTFLKYASDESSLQTLDLSPALAYQINDQFSIGGGFDAVYMQLYLSQYATSLVVENDTISENNLKSWGYGYHLGFLYQPTTTIRAGITYHSSINENLRGTSKFSGPIASDITNVTQTSNDLLSNFSMPAYTMLSYYQDVTKHWAAYGSLTYTQWSSFENIYLQNIASYNQNGDGETNSAQAYIPQNFKDTWNIALGAKYQVNDNWAVRSGVGYDQTPVTDSYRTVQIPDNNRFAFALGAQYKINRKVIIDAGWTHFFINNAPINRAVTVGDTAGEPNSGQTTDTVGQASADVNVYGLQLTWNMS